MFKGNFFAIVRFKSTPTWLVVTVFICFIIFVTFPYNSYANVDPRKVPTSTDRSFG